MTREGEYRWWKVRFEEFGEYLTGFVPVVDLTGSVVDFGGADGATENE